MYHYITDLDENLLLPFVDGGFLYLNSFILFIRYANPLSIPLNFHLVIFNFNYDYAICITYQPKFEVLG